MSFCGLVRCGCYEKGRTSEPPVPQDWIYLGRSGALVCDSELCSDEDGEKGWEWQQTACEHPMMCASEGRVASGHCLTLFDRILRAVGKDRFPTLLDGYGARKSNVTLAPAAARALAELEDLRSLRRSGLLDPLFEKDELRDEEEFMDLPEFLRELFQREAEGCNLDRETFDDICDQFEQLFRASVETGNPIFWS